jgi:hypothetical protein
MDEKVNPIVRLWWAAEDKIPGLLPVERRFFRAMYAVRHPRYSFSMWRKWRDRPRIGDSVRDCGRKIHVVTGFGDTEDDLIFEDGSRASWMSCCDKGEGNDGQAHA